MTVIAPAALALHLPRAVLSVVLPCCDCECTQLYSSVSVLAPRCVIMTSVSLSLLADDVEYIGIVVGNIHTDTLLVTDERMSSVIYTV